MKNNKAETTEDKLRNRIKQLNALVRDAIKQMYFVNLHEQCENVEKARRKIMRGKI